MTSRLLLAKMSGVIYWNNRDEARQVIRNIRTMHRSGLIELEAVMAVARRRSFRAAARDMGMSTSALSNAVIGLEERLGVRLFNRTTRSVGLTEAGEQFVERVGPALSEIRVAIDVAGMKRFSPKGVLRINSSVGAARQALLPLVLEYLRRYPEMEVVIATDGRLVDIVADGWDAGIRTVGSVPRDMVSVPIGRAFRFIVVGSPAYLANRGVPQQPADLLQHRCIRGRMPNGDRSPWEFSRGGRSFSIEVPGQLTLDDPTLMLDAARDGVGLAYMADWYPETDLRSGRLVQVLQDHARSEPGLCLYYPGRRHVPPSLSALVEVIRELRPG